MTILIDGRPGEHLPADDRGLLYGDGLFETLRVNAGRVPLWEWHWRRLRHGCAWLGIEPPDPGMIQDEVGELAGPGEAVVRVVLTRGSGAGYAPPREAKPRRILHFLGPAPPTSKVLENVIVCETRLGDSPALAGPKHLCRLEQVLAAAEVRRAGADEGLVRDLAGQPVEGIQGNLMAVLDGELVTPPVDRCGVSGVYRQFLIDRGALSVQALTWSDLGRCQALFIGNGVRQAQPVARLGDGRLFSRDDWGEVLGALPRP